MVPILIPCKTPLFVTSQGIQKKPFKDQNLFPFRSKICCSNRPQNPAKNSLNSLNGYKRSKTHILLHPCDDKIPQIPTKSILKDRILSEKNEFLNEEILCLCGFGYTVNGFRGFPWLALNFHMSNTLFLPPSTMQLLQNAGNLPMVAKPLYGILSDALYIGGAHRVPYISIGVLLQILSWGSLALIPIASESRPALVACVLISNLGASISEVAKDAIIAEYGQKNKLTSLQSYAFIASAIGGILGNLIGGFFLLKTRQTKSMFLLFAAILGIQLTISLKTREESLGLSGPSDDDNALAIQPSIPHSIKKQCSDLMVAIKEERILRPLIWIFSSIISIPILSGSLFCYQTQYLNLDPSIIGMSKVTGQLMLLSLTIIYDRFGRNIPMRKISGFAQCLYAFSLLLDLVLVTQLNLGIGIPNEVYTLFFSGLSETIAQFKLLPFYVLFASLSPPGCEGSLMSFLVSALCLSSIFSGFLGIGLAHFLGITSGNYSNLPLGIGIQFLAALLPLYWMDFLPQWRNVDEKEAKKGGRSKRSRRNRRVGKVVFESVNSYRRERESDLLR